MKKKVDPKIEILLVRYEELLEKERELDALKERGVDNWEGYGEAMCQARDNEEE